VDGIVAAMKTQKVTAYVDRALLRRARERTGSGVSATIRQGLTLVAAGAAYEKLRALRGRVKYSVDPRALREDRT
jgi:SAM-dependent MidA family methyltransferase